MGEPRYKAHVLCIKGTWEDTSGPDCWTKRGGVLDEAVLAPRGYNTLDHPDEWDGKEEGLVIQSAWDHVRGKDAGADWIHAGERLANHITATYLPSSDLWTPPAPLIILAHSHGNQVVAHALDTLNSHIGPLTEVRDRYPGWAAPMNQTMEDWLRRRPVFWLAADPPVRRELGMVYNAASISLRVRNGGYHGIHTWDARGGFILQTRSSGLDPRAWPRYLGARRWPWDHSVIAEHALCPAVVRDQPGGHSNVLHHPERYLEWWNGLFDLVDEVFRGGTPVLPGGPAGPIPEGGSR